ncbi:GNAT family N-acetyltransferase [Sphingomonas sp. HDW15A]|uniref:GNAT family N-acetyltransferase n=1 Tax=Sphingomonas sp. HDW15A TaxID=2714942 RepID=UPI001407B8EE|nr:GNAT family N-acetyltransferase [Sphingomonas sp. HDW15A]QIK95309.1 GNAT family N-acetyltransferase [Sphingomonas sp. HDW15A]
MFARTERLLLRPGWAEDAPALARAIADEMIVRNLANAPWPYGLAEAEAFLAAPKDPILPNFLLFARTDGDPVLVGSCGLIRKASGAIALGYWIARDHWGRGYATEAGRQLIEIARTIGIERLDASYFVDNPASGRVLEKLGFMATGLRGPQFSCARGHEAEAVLMRQWLVADAEGEGALAA